MSIEIVLSSRWNEASMSRMVMRSPQREFRVRVRDVLGEMEFELPDAPDGGATATPESVPPPRARTWDVRIKRAPELVF